MAQTKERLQVPAVTLSNKFQSYRWHPDAHPCYATKQTTEGYPISHRYIISFDIDTLDPAFVPGTGTPEPGGLTPREALPIVRRLCAKSNLVGFELVELSPWMGPPMFQTWTQTG